MFKGLRERIGSVLSRFTKRVEEELPKEEPAIEHVEELPKPKASHPEQRHKPKKAEKKQENIVPEQKPSEPEVKREVLTAESEGAPSLKQRFTDLFTKTRISEAKFEDLFWELEIGLLESNMAQRVIDKVKQDLKAELVDKPLPRRGIEELLRQSLKKSLMEVLGFEVPNIIRLAEGKKPFVMMFVGVNGSGKTTTIAKICKLFLDKKKRCVMVAADTFRAAAIQQLEEHANALGVKLIKQDYGADPAAVAYDGIAYAKSHGIDVVLIDTAGRLHTNKNLMDELKKIKRVAKPDAVLYIGEAITGNDCIEQAGIYDREIGIDGIVLTKLDVDEKGGTAISIAYVTNKPIWLIGTGQGYDAIEVFNPEKIIKGLGL